MRILSLIFLSIFTMQVIAQETSPYLITDTIPADQAGAKFQYNVNGGAFFDAMRVSTKKRTATL